jgi:GABA(A) receptor-associated protein
MINNKMLLNNKDMENSYIAFKDEYPFEERLAEAKKILEKYPGRVPVIVETFKQNGFFYGSKELPQLDKRKYLVPDITVGQFLYILRKKLSIAEHEGVFLFFGDKQTLVSNSESMLKVYEDHRSDDFYVYVAVAAESVFG